MKKIVFSLLLFTCCIISATQAQSWQWGRRGGGSSGSNNQAEKIVDMQTDKNGNVYMLAQLDGGGDATVSTQGNDSALLFNGGTRDGALISYDCNGKFRWAKVLGSSTYDDAAIGMTMDTLGHIYVAMSTSIDFNVDTDTSAANPKYKTIGLLQFDTAGHYKWFKMANPDTTKYAKNLGEYYVNNIATMPNGDTYLYCRLGTGLIAGSTNLVVNTKGWYMLKYNLLGQPKELIKLDLNIPLSPTTGTLLGDYLDGTNFSVTKSRKFIFTGVKIEGNNPNYPVIVGGVALKHHINLICFSNSGSVLWKVTDSDTTTGGISGRPIVDDSNGSIYIVGGGVKGWASGDSLNGVPFVNTAINPQQGSGIPFIAKIDTLGNVIYVKNGSVNNGIGSSIRSLVKRSDGRFFGYGDGVGITWDGFKFVNPNFIGLQTFMPSFDANTGTVLSMDSLMGSSSATYASVIAADNNNNVYVGGRLSYDVKVGAQTLTTMGGQSDFFVAKYGYANCSGSVPLKFINYEIRYTNERKVENIWTTANEVNVSHFNILRSTNGRDFVNIGQVKANNKSYNEYSFIDPLTINNLVPTIYYRIESVDKDGYKDYSEIRNVELGIRNGGISVYPNPARDLVNVSVNKLVGKGQVYITNLLGYQLKIQSIVEGANTIDISMLSKGVYFLNIVTTGGINIKKLVIE